MPKREFSFEQGQPTRLVVSWKGRWKNIEVFLDGTKLADIPDQSALKAGYSVNLPGGSSVVVQMKPGMTAGLDVNWQGKPLPGSSADSVTSVRSSAQIVLFVAALNGLLGLLSEVLDVRFLKDAGIGIFSIAFGAVFLALGLWIWKTNSAIALVLATVLFAADALYGIALAVERGGSPTSGIIFRGLLLYYMAKGIGPARKLEKAGVP